MSHLYTPFSTRLSGSAKETQLRLRSIFQWRKRRPPLVILILVIALALGCGGLVSCQKQDEVLHLGLNARVLEIDLENRMLYVEDQDQDTGVFGSRCALDCASADLLHVNYETHELTSLDFSQFQVGDTVIVGLYDSQYTAAGEGAARAESVQLGTQRPLTARQQPSYLQVLQTAMQLQQSLSPPSDFGRGSFVDLDADGSQELVLFYESPADHLNFEAWAAEGDCVRRLAAASGLNSLTGSGNGGISIFSYGQKEYLCFWMTNSEPNPPGVRIDFDCSLWTIEGAALVDPLRLGVLYQKSGETITQVYSSYGVDNDRSLSTQECVHLIDLIQSSPGSLLCRGPAQDQPIGSPLPELLAQLETASIPVPEDAKALILDYLQETWPLHPVYYLGEEPGQPQEGDMRIDKVTFVEEAVTYETIGTAFRVERSGYHTWHSSDPGPSWQKDPSFIYVILGRDVLGNYYEVRGFEAPSANKNVNQIILEQSCNLMDLEVSLWRDGYPWPAGPGSQIHFFREAYDGKPQVEILEGWEPVYWPGAYWTQQSWEGFSALCYHVGEEPGQEDPDAYVVYSIDTTRTDLRTYRGIRVGDTREQVMEAYPELYNTHYWHDSAPDFPGQDYLWYCINSEGFGPAILFFFENDVVSLIRLNNMFN